MRRHVAYLRLSVEDKGADPEAERSVQTSTVRRLAGAVPLEIVDADWGISGSHEALPKRRAFIELTVAVERDEIEVVYAARLDRLSRDKRDLEDFIVACREHHTRVLTGDGEVQFETANQRLNVGMQGLVNQHERELTKERIAAGVARWIERGNAPGTAPYGWRFVKNADGVRVLAPDPSQDVDVLLAAVREAGSFRGGAKLLNERGIPTARHGGLWRAPTIYKILTKQRPEAVDAPSVRRRGATSSKLLGRGKFRRLLRCHCANGADHWMTPKPQRVIKGRLLMSYACTPSRTDPTHSRPGEVSELRLLEWAREAVGRTLAVELTDAPDKAIDLAALDERRKRAAVAFTMGAMTRDELAEVQLEIAKAQNAGTARRKIKSFRLVPFDWDRPDVEINADLRAMWREIRLGPDMRPVEAVEWEGV